MTRKREEVGGEGAASKPDAQRADDATRDGHAQADDRIRGLLADGTQALHKRDLATAVSLLEQAWQLDNENADAALNLGAAYILSNRFRKAVSILEPLSEDESRNPMVWTNLGAAYLGNPVLAGDENQARAIAAFERAFELNPATPNVAYNLGLIHRDRQDYDKALHWFTHAIQADPNDQDARRLVQRLKQRADAPEGAGDDERPTFVDKGQGS
jgi:tetratricopeptide (TPR) repeat protein